MSHFSLIGRALLAGCTAVATGVAAAGNPISYFRAEDAAAYTRSVSSITNMQQNGELYGMTWDKDADYHMDRALAGGCTNAMSAIEWLCKSVLNGAPTPKVAGVPGCTSFTATNAVGDRLVGRNFDYRLPMSHVLLFVPKNEAMQRKYSSVGTVDGGWVGYGAGQLDDGTTDLSYAALFPYYCMDGMNEKGFSAAILSLDGRPRPLTGEKTWMTEQFWNDRRNIVTTLALRYLLDNADSTQKAVELLGTFNMFAAVGGDLGIVANYHLYLCDKSGDTRVVEWMPPANEGESWELREVTDAKAVSNFYLSDGYGHGSNRWEIARHALARQNDHLEAFDAMNLCRAVGQHKGAEQTSWTHWSVVYNLSELTANIATLGNYGEIFPYAFKGEDGWSFGAPTSAKPVVRTDLPLFPSDPKTATSDRIYLLADPIVDPSGSSGEPPSFAGASVAAVNRIGLTYDAPGVTLHAVATNSLNAKVPAVFYIDMSSGDVSKAAYSIVAGVNCKGLAGRVVKFRDSTGPGDISPSQTLLAVLNNSGTVDAASVIMKANKQSAGGCGFVLSDAMGNVAIWGPEGAELCEDDASAMVRNSLDLRKGVYEADGEGRGEFDELPGLMRLASTSDTKTIVSMGYGHLDVMLPESNVVWRAEIKGAEVPAYGVIADPTPVPHATVKLVRTDDWMLVRNNQGRLVAQTNTEIQVEYFAEGDSRDGYDCYFFQSGKKYWSASFRVGPTRATPPAPDVAPVRPVPMEYTLPDGNTCVGEYVIVLSSSQMCQTMLPDPDVFFAVTNDVVLSAGLVLESVGTIILADGASLTVVRPDGDEVASLTGYNSLLLFGQKKGTGRMTVRGGKNAAGVKGNCVGIHVCGGMLDITGGEGSSAVDGGGLVSVQEGCNNLSVRAGDGYLPQTLLGKAGKYSASDFANRRYITVAPEMPVKTTAVSHTTQKVYVDGQEAVTDATGTYVWSNQTATVVYTADAGYRFADGSTEFTVALDTSKSPATKAAGQLVPSAVPITVPVTYHAAGGAYSDGVAEITRPEALVTGYQLPPEPPTRKGFLFTGWFTSWKSEGVEVLKGEAITNREHHTFYAHWTSTAPTPAVGELNLPDFLGGKPNRSIAEGAYNKDTSLVSVVTPLYLGTIGDYAFNGCTSLKSLTITTPRDYDTFAPSSVAIGRNAFSGCSALEEVYVAGEISAIGQSAFQNCMRLKRIVFGGDAAISVGKSAFYGCGYQNGTGKITVYMSSAFQSANAAFVADLRTWFSAGGIDIVEKVDVTPIAGLGGLQVDFSRLAVDRRLAVLVKTDAVGRPDVDSVVIEYTPTLSPANWLPLAAKTKTAFADGTALVEVVVPDGTSGYLRAKVDGIN